MNRVKRGKPHKRETQIMVGELSKEKKESIGWMGKTIDKCLSPITVQNVAYKIILFLF